MRPFQLQTRGKFASWLPRTVANAHETCQVSPGLPVDRREDVDALVEAAARHGGKADLRAPVDMGRLCDRAFEDRDGNALEASWLDPKAG
jgi:predicted lactoylglutathione lyase